VLVEPDGLSKLPSDCGSAYPGQDLAALTQARINDISYAAEQTENSDLNVSNDQYANDSAEPPGVGDCSQL